MAVVQFCQSLVWLESELDSPNFSYHYWLFSSVFLPLFLLYFCIQQVVTSNADTYKFNSDMYKEVLKLCTLY